MTGWFDSGIMAVILLNTVALAVEYHDPQAYGKQGMSTAYIENLAIFSHVFNAIFYAE